MGLEPKTSVRNRNNQVWDGRKFLCDRRRLHDLCLLVNPSLTYMALNLPCPTAISRSSELKKKHL